MKLIKVLCVIVPTWMLFSAAAGAALSTDRQARLSLLRQMTLEHLQEVEIMVNRAPPEQQIQLRAAMAVTVVSAEEIKQRAYRSLREIIEGVYGPGHFANYLRVLLDGEHFDDNVYETEPPSLDFRLDPELIDRVEIVRGPVASQYGSNAHFVLINVVTLHGGGSMR